MSVVLETGAETQDLDGGWAAREQFTSAQGQWRATPWSHTALLEHWQLQFKQTGGEGPFKKKKKTKTRDHLDGVDGLIRFSVSLKGNFVKMCR